MSDPPAALLDLFADAFQHRLRLQGSLAIRLQGAAMVCAAWHRDPPDAVRQVPMMLLALPPKRWRAMLSYIFEAPCHRSVQQAALAQAWVTSSAHLAAAARGHLLPWLRAADFQNLVPLPSPLDAWYPQMRIDQLPPVFAAFRGCAGISAEAAAMGSSWSLRRDVAATYAAKIRATAGKPVVVRRLVERSEVLMRAPTVATDEIVLPPARPGTWSAEMTAPQIATAARKGAAYMRKALDALSPRQKRDLIWSANRWNENYGDCGRGVVLATAETGGTN